jgi:hypothetical protein
MTAAPALEIAHWPRHLIWQLPRPIKRLILRAAQPRAFDRYRRLMAVENAEASGVLPWLRHGCIFVHVPKTAGLSVQTGLFGRSRTSGHLALGIYEAVLPRARYRRFLKVAFVRNPWDRLVSAYEFLRAGGLTARDREWADVHLSRFDSFPDFVHSWVNRRNVWREIHFVPQHALVALRGRNGLDLTLRFEHLERDYAMVAARLGVDGELASLNRTPVRERDYRSYYDRETAAKVGAVYREDVELLGYSFDG